MVLDEGRAVIDAAEAGEGDEPREGHGARERRPAAGGHPLQKPGDPSAPPARTAQTAASGSRNRALAKKRRIEAAQAAQTTARAAAARGDPPASRAAPATAGMRRIPQQIGFQRSQGDRALWKA